MGRTYELLLNKGDAQEEKNNQELDHQMVPTHSSFTSALHWPNTNRLLPFLHFKDKYNNIDSHCLFHSGRMSPNNFLIPEERCIVRNNTLLLFCSLSLFFIWHTSYVQS